MIPCSQCDNSLISETKFVAICWEILNFYSNYLLLTCLRGWSRLWWRLARGQRPLGGCWRWCTCWIPRPPAWSWPPPASRLWSGNSSPWHRNDLRWIRSVKKLSKSLVSNVYTYLDVERRKVCYFCPWKTELTVLYFTLDRIFQWPVIYQRMAYQLSLNFGAFSLLQWNN